MTAIKITTPADLVSAVPSVLGFAPADSVVMLGMGGSRVGACARVDMPTTPTEAADAAEAVACGLGAATPIEVVLVRRGSRWTATPTSAAACVGEAAAVRAAVKIWRQTGVGRWWALLVNEWVHQPRW